MATSETRVNMLLEEHTRLRALEAEYRVTVKVLAVVIEQLLGQTSGQHVVITDETLMNSPDLVAWRDESESQVVITVAR